MLSAISTLLSLAAVVSSAPTASFIGSGAFSAPAVHQPNFVRNGTAAMLKAYAKHHLKPTREFPAAFLDELAKRQDSSASAFPSNGVEYLVSTTVGGQKLNLDFDTGSADLWVFSSLLPSSDDSGHNIYSSSKSKSFKSLKGYTWSIQYADGSGASGVVGLDTVTIGGTTVTGQAVELANQVSSTFVSDGSDGLVGLAFSSINTVSPQPQSTFFDNAQPSLNSPLFAAYLPNQADGAYDFGALDSSHYSGSVVYANVDSSNGFWEYPSTSYKVGSTVHTLAGQTGISDTGTTLILTADAAVNAYYAKVSGAKYDSSQGGYTFPCSATLPTFSFKIGTTSYATIPGSLMNFGVASGNTCFGSLQSVGGGTQNIYGDVFFNAYYGVFDASGPRFGFAPIA